MNRPYLLVSKVEGIADRIINASTRSGALAVAAEATWDVTPIDALTVKAWERLSVKAEAPVAGQLDLLPSEGG
jgi:hypothetical protein